MFTAEVGRLGGGGGWKKRRSCSDSRDDRSNMSALSTLRLQERPFSTGTAAPLAFSRGAFSPWHRCVRIKVGLMRLLIYAQSCNKILNKKSKSKCLWVRVAERLLMTSLVPSLSNYRRTPRSKKCIYGQNIIKQTSDISQTDWQLLSLVFGWQPQRQRRTLWFAISQAPWLYFSGMIRRGARAQKQEAAPHPEKKTKVNSLISKNVLIFFLSVVLWRMTLCRRLCIYSMIVHRAGT